MDKRLRKIRITLIRSELYNYYLTQKEVQDLKQTIKENENIDSEETTNFSINLLTNIQINRCIRWIAAIEWALQNIESGLNGETKRKMINYKYFSCVHTTDDGLALKCHIHVNTLRNWDNEFLSLIASRVGLKI